MSAVATGPAVAATVAILVATEATTSSFDLRVELRMSCGASYDLRPTSDVSVISGCGGRTCVTNLRVIWLDSHNFLL